MSSPPDSPHEFIALLTAHGNELHVAAPTARERAAWRRALYALINSDAVPDGYCIKHTGRDHGDLTVRLVPRTEAAPPEPPVPVPTRLTKLHPAIAAVRDAAGNRRTDWVDTRGEVGMLHIHVTAGQVRRVLLLAQALVDEAVRRGHGVGIVTPYRCPGGLGIVVAGHDIEVVFAEGTHRVPHELTVAEREREERSSWSYAPRWDYHPTGFVELRAGHTVHDSRLAGDRTRWKLEDRLARAFTAIESLASAAEARDQEHREREARAEAAREAALHQARLAFDEARRVEHLHDQVVRLRLARDIRDFATHARTAAVDVDDAWLEWAVNYADRIDPTRARLAGPDSIEPTSAELAPFLQRTRAGYAWGQ